MRLFVAAAPNVQTRIGVGSVARRCRRHAGTVRASIKWVETGNLHLTLAFLGENHPEAVGRITKALSQPWPNPVFSVILSEAGAFPAPGVPKVLWIGVGKGRAHLRTLREQVEARREPFGVLPERPRSSVAPYHRSREVGHANYGYTDPRRACYRRGSANAMGRRPYRAL